MTDCDKDNCRCKGDIEQMRKEVDHLWDSLTSVKGKLNMILGGVILSPFLVALLTMLIAACTLGNGGVTTHP